VLAKLEKEFRADLTAAGSDVTALQTDKAALDKDLAEYTMLSSYGADYEVDYGTDTMSASEAISRTNADLAQNATDMATTLTAQTTLNAQVNRIWGPPPTPSRRYPKERKRHGDNGNRLGRFLIPTPRTRWPSAGSTAREWDACWDALAGGRRPRALCSRRSGGRFKRAEGYTPLRIRPLSGP
jgi:hypothetical protein